MATRTGKAIGGLIAILIVAIGIYASQSEAEDVGLVGYEREFASSSDSPAMNKSASATCPDGKVIAGGGYAITGLNPGSAVTYVNGPSNASSWTVFASAPSPS